MTIYNQISSNKRKTVFVMIGFILVISLIGYFFGEVFAGPGAGFPFLLLALLLSIGSSIFSFYNSDKVVLSIAGAKEAPEGSQIKGLVENLCVGAGLKIHPKVYIIPDRSPNAFATGRDPEHSAIAVTEGLLTTLNKRELEAVLAHELSHIKNYDIRLMTIVVILVGTITMIANVMLRGSFSSSRRSSGIIVLIAFLLALLSPVFAQLIKLAVSRTREYLADASAAMLTRDPEGLATALEKIASDKHVLKSANEATAHMYIENPLKKGVNSSFMAGLFNTHPPVEERIKRLRSM